MHKMWQAFYNNFVKVLVTVPDLRNTEYISRLKTNKGKMFTHNTNASKG